MICSRRGANLCAFTTGFANRPGLKRPNYLADPKRRLPKYWGLSVLTDLSDPFDLFRLSLRPEFDVRLLPVF
jgi:hypothetical protein